MSEYGELKGFSRTGLGYRFSTFREGVPTDVRLSMLKWEWSWENKDSWWPLVSQEAMVMGHMPGPEVSYVTSYKIKGFKIAIKVNARTEGMKADRSGNRSWVTDY